MKKGNIKIIQKTTKNGKIIKNNKKFICSEQNKNIKKRSNTVKKRLYGRYFRLVIPRLEEYGENPNIESNEICKLKVDVLKKIHDFEHKRGLTNWTISAECHPITKYAHLDILMIYSKKVQTPYTRYDYVIKHGDLTKYRTLNRAILEYGKKEDPNPISNMDVDKILLLDKASDKKGCYEILEAAMLKDPFEFNPHEYIHSKDLNRKFVKISWVNVINMIKKKQSVVCSNILKKKLGFKIINRSLIEHTLSKQELELYDSWSGYQTIVDHLNQIPRYGYKRPHKTKNLFVFGPPNSGKTSLALKIEDSVAVYPLGIKNGWFPRYKSKVYKMLVWDEFNLKTLPYGDLLKLLEGRPMELPIKGGHAKRADNQLIYMNSNCSLEQLIRFKFKSAELRRKSFFNLSARITVVEVPQNKNLFILCKLIDKIV